MVPVFLEHMLGRVPDERYMNFLRRPAGGNNHTTQKMGSTHRHTRNVHINIYLIVIIIIK